MKPWFLIVADSARARFFAMHWPEDITLESAPKLVELEDFVNPDGKLKTKDVYTDRAGISSGRHAGPRPAFDEHRDGWKREVSERFARRIAEVLSERGLDRNAARLVVAAEARMLPHLHKAIAARLPKGLEVTELANDLSRQTAAQILDALVRHGIVPPPRLPEAAVYRPRGQAPPGSS